MPLPSKEELKEAIVKAVQYSPKRNFKQSVELIVVLKDVDPRSPEGRIRETIFLPKGLGKDKIICVVADGEMAEKARAGGAHRVITRDELLALSKKDAKKVAQECDWVLVRTDLMANAGRILGPALGPRGKIPVPVPPAADIVSVMNRYKSAILLRNKDQPQLMTRIGTEDMNPEDLVINAQTILSRLETKLPNGAHNIAKIVVKTTMGPPIEVMG
ncbi:LSU ribosomal protein L1P [Staphylothermus marinus F1]|uniref:Large ribosomal subunit protein uL1 n=1 Tax=Staphylothermus marinus (strain ATCC 43588 / DSM 3639 / JCM 9404 / F1) TaxID=399550 RepID=RL1_STAMF|nr:50S ribosomal protein L1 [Staphylothermus marinus]A3DNI1.1 RecName: Full=Large ribosomal subunit protein uL1; AltName: Full=50S ribosomal protein L1 [Staphylothermus marinus F1]ABN70191.1 LSU ribosomal protein L1P [Staphylothermus marinus F1]